MYGFMYVQHNSGCVHTEVADWWLDDPSCDVEEVQKGCSVGAIFMSGN